MITYDVNVSYQAEQDLRGIFEYIAFELLAPENAQSQLGRLETAIKPFRKNTGSTKRNRGKAET